MNDWKKKWRNKTYKMQAPFFKLVSQADKITVQLLSLNTDLPTLHVPSRELGRNCLQPRLYLIEQLPQETQG